MIAAAEPFADLAATFSFGPASLPHYGFLSSSRSVVTFRFPGVYAYRCPTFDGRREHSLSLRIPADSAPPGPALSMHTFYEWHHSLRPSLACLDFSPLLASAALFVRF